MDNLQPVHRKKSQGREVSRKENFLFPVSREEKKKKPDPVPGEVGLSRWQVQLLTILLIGMCLCVGLLAVWITSLLSDIQQRDLKIQNQTQQIASLQQNDSLAPSTPVSTPAFVPLPEDLEPGIAQGVENPQVAVSDAFHFEEFFLNSVLTLEESRALTYYICNDKAALRLIRDSGLPYFISRYSTSQYSLLLVGTYEPSWVVELENLRKIRQEMLLEASQIPGAGDTTAATSASAIPQIPPTLEGLEVRRVNLLYSIQVLAEADRDRVEQKAAVLRNQGIPAYVFSFRTSGARSAMNSLRVGVFPTDIDAKNYSSTMDSALYLELINKKIGDRFIRQLTLE
ncbi:MAG TPA: LapA family protein [Thermotogota bacterium]|nr:LapA family protein [Thermotogota bacterium]